MELLRNELSKVGGTLTSAIYYTYNVESNGRLESSQLELMAKSIQLSGSTVTMIMAEPDHKHYALEAIRDLDALDRQTFVQFESPIPTYTNTSLGFYREQAGFLYSMSDPDVDIIAEDDDNATIAEGAGVSDMFWARYNSDTTRFGCENNTGANLFANIEEDPRVFDYTIFSSYTMANPPVYGPFTPVCQPGDGQPGTPNLNLNLNLGYYDVAWIYALAIRRMLAANATFDDVKHDGPWLLDSLLNTSWHGLRYDYAFDRTTQDLSQRVAVYNMQQSPTADEAQAGYDLVKVFASSTAFYASTSNCDVGAGEAGECIDAVENATTVWNPRQRRDVPLDGREVTASKCRFGDDIQTSYNERGNKTVEVELWSNFEELPAFGTIFDVYLREPTSGADVWSGASEIPAATSTTFVPFVVPDWGSYDLFVLDHYTRDLVASTIVRIVASPPECPPFEVWSDDISGCATCPLGRQEVNGACESCAPGRFRDASVSICLNCPETGFSSNPGSTNCTSCPRNSRRYEYDYVRELLDSGLSLDATHAIVGTNQSECSCASGYYASAGPRKSARSDGENWGIVGVPCLPCAREGADCSNGRTWPPYNEEGYYGDHNVKDPFEFYKCAVNRCSQKYKCSHGYRGRKCSLLITHKFFSVAGLHPPFKCPNLSSLHNGLIFSSLLIAILCLWIYINIFFGHKSLDIFFERVQLVAIIARFKVDYPVQLNSYLSVLYNFVLCVVLVTLTETPRFAGSTPTSSNHRA